MADLIFILVTVAFFAIAAAYVRGCDRLWGGPDVALDYVVGGVIAVLIGAYLVYALLRPERFW